MKSAGLAEFADILSEAEIAAVEQAVGYNFKNKALVCQAFCHSSYARQHDIGDNERMEFFGDAVLEYIVSEYLFARYANLDQGELSKVRASVVSADGLRPAVDRLDILRYLKVASNAAQIKSTSKKIEANLYEAVLCAVYQDGGMRAARKFVLSSLATELGRINSHEKDIKSLVLEYCQGKRWHAVFETVDKSGPDNQPVFTRQLVVNGKAVSRGVGPNKTAADREAANKIAKQWRID